jgi:hypothetical protein
MAQTAKPYAKIPTLLDRVQDELSAIAAITRVLGSLPDHETRLRVITWVNDRFTQGVQTATPETPVAPPRHAISDPALTIPDDLFDPIETSEPVDLRDVFDLPAAKPHLYGLESVSDRRAETAPPVGTRLPEDTFELVPPTETSLPTDLRGVAADEPVRVIDRRQLNLLLLADMSTPAALMISASPTADDAGDLLERDRDAVSSRRLRVLATIKARHTTPLPPGNTTPAPASAAAARKTPTEPIGAQPTSPAHNSMEGMLRTLVDDFRQLGDDWGNT